MPDVGTARCDFPGENAGVAEATTVQYRADTNSTQKQGLYSTTVIYSATAKP
jgi:hypothetical protein